MGRGEYDLDWIQRWTDVHAHAFCLGILATSPRTVAQEPTFAPIACRSSAPGYYPPFGIGMRFGMGRLRDRTDPPAERMALGQQHLAAGLREPTHESDHLRRGTGRQSCH